MLLSGLRDRLFCDNRSQHLPRILTVLQSCCLATGDANRRTWNEVSPGRDTTEALVIQVILISNYRRPAKSPTLIGWHHLSACGRTGSTHNFAIAKERNVVPMPKLGYKASRIYTTSTDSGWHRRLPNIQDGGQGPEVVIIIFANSIVFQNTEHTYTQSHTHTA